MIIYNLRTPMDTDKSICVGIVGDNKTFIQEFFIEGMTDSSFDYSIHLRFPDGKVNSVIPDETVVNSKGTKIVWNVKKTDIFEHGFFDVQLEGTNDEGKVFQTSIVTLYADESLAVEDKEYENPNAETLRLREEAHEMLCELKLQQNKLDENIQTFLRTDITKKADKAEVESALSTKADKALTLGGYGITDAYTSAQTDALLDIKEISTLKVSAPKEVTDEARNYPSVKYLKQMYYDFDEADNLLEAKADKAEVENVLAEKVDKTELETSLGTKADKALTLSGYGITDGVTLTKLNTELAKKQNSLTFDETATAGHINNVMSSHAISLALSSVREDSRKKYFEKSSIEHGVGNFNIYTSSVADSNIVKSASFEYVKTGEVVDVFYKIQFNEGNVPNYGYWILTGLPFNCSKSLAHLHHNVTTTTSGKNVVVYPNGSWLSILMSSGEVSNNDAITGHISLIVNS